MVIIHEIGENMNEYICEGFCAELEKQGASKISQVLAKILHNKTPKEVSKMLTNPVERMKSDLPYFRAIAQSRAGRQSPINLKDVMVKRMSKLKEQAKQIKQEKNQKVLNNLGISL